MIIWIFFFKTDSVRQHGVIAGDIVNEESKNIMDGGSFY